METIKGMVYTKDCVFAPGILTIEKEIIKEVRLCQQEELSNEESACYLLPGLVDIHFHGAAGYDFCDGTLENVGAMDCQRAGEGLSTGESQCAGEGLSTGESLRAMESQRAGESQCAMDCLRTGENLHTMENLRVIEEYENCHGITSICPATMTLPIEELHSIVNQVANSGLKSLRGIHLEGPFLSKEKKGAQKEEYMISPDTELLRELQKSANGLIKIVSIAPEIEGALTCMEDLKDQFCFSIAHTTADYETAKKAIEAGAEHVTHLYNAMPVPTHREPSVFGAASDSEKVDVELICDGIHVHPSMVRNAFRIFGDDRVILVSDSMRATGMGDGNYTLGGQQVIVKGTRATLADGTIAGSVTNLYDCMKNAISMGISKEFAIKAATINPARSIEIDKEYGSLEAGKKADILFTDADLNLKGVMIWGSMRTRSCI